MGAETNSLNSVLKAIDDRKQEYGEGLKGRKEEDEKNRRGRKEGDELDVDDSKRKSDEEEVELKLKRKAAEEDEAEAKRKQEMAQEDEEEAKQKRKQAADAELEGEPEKARKLEAEAEELEEMAQRKQDSADDLLDNAKRRKQEADIGDDEAEAKRKRDMAYADEAEAKRKKQEAEDLDKEAEEKRKQATNLDREADAKRDEDDKKGAEELEKDADKKRKQADELQAEAKCLYTRAMILEQDAERKLDVAQDLDVISQKAKQNANSSVNTNKALCDTYELVAQEMNLSAKRRKDEGESLGQLAKEYENKSNEVDEPELKKALKGRSDILKANAEECSKEAEEMTAQAELASKKARKTDPDDIPVEEFEELSDTFSDSSKRKQNDAEFLRKKAEDMRGDTENAATPQEAHAMRQVADMLEREAFVVDSSAGEDGVQSEMAKQIASTGRSLIREGRDYAFITISKDGGKVEFRCGDMNGSEPIAAHGRNLQKTYDYIKGMLKKAGAREFEVRNDSSKRINEGEDAKEKDPDEAFVLIDKEKVRYWQGKNKKGEVKIADHDGDVQKAYDEAKSKLKGANQISVKNDSGTTIKEGTQGIYPHEQGTIDRSYGEPDDAEYIEGQFGTGQQVSPELWKAKQELENLKRRCAGRKMDDLEQAKQSELEAKCDMMKAKASFEAEAEKRRKSEEEAEEMAAAHARTIKAIRQSEKRKLDAIQQQAESAVQGMAAKLNMFLMNVTSSNKRVVAEEMANDPRNMNANDRLAKMRNLLNMGTPVPLNHVQSEERVRELETQLREDSERIKDLKGRVQRKRQLIERQKAQLTLMQLTESDAEGQAIRKRLWNNVVTPDLVSEQIREEYRRIEDAKADSLLAEYAEGGIPSPSDDDETGKRRRGAEDPFADDEDIKGRKDDDVEDVIIDDDDIEVSPKKGSQLDDNDNLGESLDWSRMTSLSGINE